MWLLKPNCRQFIDLFPLLSGIDTTPCRFRKWKIYRFQSTVHSNNVKSEAIHSSIFEHGWPLQKPVWTDNKLVDFGKSLVQKAPLTFPTILLFFIRLNASIHKSISTPFFTSMPIPWHHHHSAVQRISPPIFHSQRKCVCDASSHSKALKKAENATRDASLTFTIEESRMAR
jgi:hypothetical protein